MQGRSSSQIPRLRPVPSDSSSAGNRSARPPFLLHAHSKPTAASSRKRRLTPDRRKSEAWMAGASVPVPLICDFSFRSMSIQAYPRVCTLQQDGFQTRTHFQALERWPLAGAGRPSEVHKSSLAKPGIFHGCGRLSGSGVAQ